MQKCKVGIIGCGNISSVYFKNSRMFDILDIIACADLIPERAEAQAKEFNIPKACSKEELLADPEIQLVVNLTIPQAHADICIAALEAGKNVYTEKPLAITREDGKRILRKAKEKKLLVGSAPDTFLAGGLQTCRKLMDDGWIGEPIGVSAFVVSHGPESWHPDPAFLYKIGAGPLFDLGPYYLTAMVSLLGPVKRVSGSARITFPERVITSAPRYGTKIRVEVPTHISGVLDFANGAVGTLITSFDIWGSELPQMEVYGTLGTISVPNPNLLGGSVRIRRAGDDSWHDVPLTHGFATNCRGIGVADMAHAILEGRANRASGELAYHVVDIMHGICDASREGKYYEMLSTCSMPEPLSLGILPKSPPDM